MALRHRLVVTGIILLAAIDVACGGPEPTCTLKPNPLPTFLPPLAPMSAAHPTSDPTRTGAPRPTPILDPTPNLALVLKGAPTPTATPTSTPVSTATTRDEPKPPPLGRPCRTSETSFSRRPPLTRTPFSISAQWVPSQEATRFPRITYTFTPGDRGDARLVEDTKGKGPL